MNTFLLNTEVSISDVIAIFSLVSILISAGFALYQWHFSLKLKRAEYIKNLFDKIRTSPQIIFEVFDDEEEWYTKKFDKPENKEFERNIDYTLSYFSYICYLKKNKIISKSEFDFFKYELDRILKNSCFINYIYNLYHWSQNIEIAMPFIDLFNYANEHNIFDKEFFNKNSKKYPHYLTN